jgi:hypothetical protein
MGKRAKKAGFDFPQTIYTISSRILYMKKAVVLLLMIVSIMAISGCKVEETLDDEKVEISEELKTRIMARYDEEVNKIRVEQGFGKDEYTCYSPELRVLDFDYLSAKKRLYNLKTDCAVTGDPCGSLALGNLLFYEKDGVELIMFKEDRGPAGLEIHFEQLFADMSTEEEMLEYLALIDSSELMLLEDVDWDLNACKFFMDAPEVDKVITEGAGLFTYEGFWTESYINKALFYDKYTITSTGLITHAADETIADCGPGWIC